ncbi:MULTISPECIES: trigger factor [unclassified Cryobacterium]|uniref:trigger factor n=1 Tax=unclassified Cryobacterium TaxID=2649013 RepID=UPI00106DB341|nr:MULTISPECIES: trigger factor [unclassified Cryobacterium]MEB0287959.1 trigger factor [Cryobacterium sp. 10S3]MEB0305754.1 trigger factor [Cryobacterium sp. 10I1]TFB96607.1 trigger factor [Cryobacterium sp. MDB2-A-1]TFC02931.1 trigger factor [Cryobacterium sp. MDB2-33-2]TFC12891.1 trigger factor [Cryobacterium sp. MDB2-A-2]
MKSTVEKLSPTRAKVTISVTPEELKPSITHAYGHIAEDINIPGFRKGKVPPPIIDQRVGKSAVLEHAVNEGLDGFYRAAVDEHKLRPLGRPEADIVEWPSDKDFSGDLKLSIEVDVRPEIDLPAYSGLKLVVDTAEVTDEDVTEELDKLRSRFGTLITVDRPAKTGDFVQIDLVASIGDVEVDNATGISYEVGTGDLIDGIDEALDSLSATETTTFNSTLMGGDHEGETAEITVTVLAVKERELPPVDDDFAQIASEFDTVAELTEDLKAQALRSKIFGQGTQARELLIEQLLASVEVPIPTAIIEDEVRRHLEGENRLEDDVHRAEVTESSEKTFRQQILLDTIAEAEKVQVSQDELTQYLIQGAAQYGMDPSEFVQALSGNGQIPSMVAEVARNKALAIALGKAEVVDGNGAVVDLAEFTAIAGDEPEAAADGTTSVDVDIDAVTVDPAADAAAAAASEDADDEAAEVPAKPKKKAAAKK